MFSTNSNSHFFSTFRKIIQHAAKTTNPVDTATSSILFIYHRFTGSTKQAGKTGWHNRHRTKSDGHFAPGN
jgi:hypothetical protein